MDKKTALLIIDMQKGSFTNETPRYDSEGVIERINLLSGQFRTKGAPVLFIQHDGSKFDTYIPNTPEWEILDELNIKSTDQIVSKTANDAFYQSELESLLKNLEVGELVVTGCATDFCVESTIQSALVRNYNITVVSDGHTTADRPSIKAKTVIDHYNWLWQNMIPIGKPIQVVKTRDIKA